MSGHMGIELLKLLLQDSVIATFEYWSEFIVRFQRDERTKHPALKQMFGEMRIPPLFCLRLRNSWWIGDRQRWETSVLAFPLKGAHPIPPEAPMQAGILLTMLYKTQVSTVITDENLDLRLDLSDGRSITIQSVGGQWPESWFLELPVDDPDRDKWAIVCDSGSGVIAGKCPTQINGVIL
jgi:hypothetical protein